MSESRPTICLCMMVKNEAAIIRRAIESALPWIDAWAITDTGSTDDTIAVAIAALADLPGMIHFSEWTDFAHGRTEAARVAGEQGCDFLLMMDADQTLVVDDPTAFAGLTGDGYHIEIRHAGLVYPHPWLLSAWVDWHWHGSTHEWLVVDSHRVLRHLRGAYLVEHGDSFRRKTGHKAYEDRALLEAAYAEDPNDTRTLFYLGQQCHDEGRLKCAIEWYTKRVKAGGWKEEAWCAQYRIGQCYDLMRNWDAAKPAYQAAHSLYPVRAEALFRLGNGSFLRHDWDWGRIYFGEAAEIDKPVSGLFVEAAIYDYAALQGFAWCCRALGRMDEAEEAEMVLLQSVRTPESVVKAIHEAIQTRTFGPLI